MSRFVFRLPDLGEGTVEAEIVGWRVQPGDEVAEDAVLVEVMTDKATVEVPSPVSGRVVSTTGRPGERVPVGAELIVLETAAADAPSSAGAALAPASAAAPPPRAAAASSPASAGAPAAPPGRAGDLAPAAAGQVANGSGGGDAEGTRARRVLTSPAIRRRARERGVDLQQVSGSGAGGRILPRDLEAHLREAGSRPRTAAGGQAARSAAAGADDAGPETIPVIGLRRVIAQRMSEAKRNIPHFSYVEEVDVTELEALRQYLNARTPDEPQMSLLPLIALGLIRVLALYPQCNAHYDATREVLLRYRAVHLGVATRTPDGLKVPVVRDAGRLGLRALAAEIRRIAAAARGTGLKRDELAGSTITITSLGRLGGIASTPIINSPEVAIVGVNRAVERPMVRDGQVVVRRMMNLSSSFDHRFVDGFEAASMVQTLRERLEHPATLFMAGAETD